MPGAFSFEARSISPVIPIRFSHATGIDVLEFIRRRELFQRYHFNGAPRGPIWKKRDDISPRCRHLRRDIVGLRELGQAGQLDELIFLYLPR